MAKVKVIIRKALEGISKALAGKKPSPVSADGMQVVASTRDDNNKEKSKKDYGNAPLSYEPLTENKIMFPKCGHLAPEEGTLSFYGEICDFKTKGRTKNINGQPTVDDPNIPCPQCYFDHVKNHLTRCSVCAIGILPGSGVALYAESSTLPHKDKSTKVRESYIGCLMWDCCPSGGFFAGHWTEKGFKSAFESGNSIAG